MDKEKQLVWDVVSTPNDIDFKEYRKTHGITWLNKERQILLMATMDIQHIISCINMLEACKQDDTMAYEGLINELRKRGELFSSFLKRREAI